MKFASFYGALWRSQLKEEGFIAFMKKEWLNSLKDFQPEIIDKAIECCLKQKEFPPTLPQFYDLCRSFQKRLDEQKEQENKTSANPAPLEVGLAHLRMIKQMLNSN
ncbi:hypothetical protein B1207_15290 [Legionella quinlivanii]|uniref:Legionella vir region protein n=1 Tax=Legionella quinlivanii TaxID=45073 RepID=A0A364LFF7_9GAMM|nr:Vir protein [Legionella quinlivanii]RAP34642.1 hypothetical protein B1207_15290 [Legionella quinlivanii]